MAYLLSIRSAITSLVLIAIAITVLARDLPEGDGKEAVQAMCSDAVMVKLINV